MKRSIKSLYGFTLKETDGELGKVKDFYFDDDSWTVRYLVVKTGKWLSNKEVVISPKVIQQIDWEHREFAVSLTRNQIQNSPDIDTEKPVSRQQEELLSSYYQWGGYWGDDLHGGAIFGMMPDELYDEEKAEGQRLSGQNVQVKKNADGDQHLRSTQRVAGHKIHASNGEIGEVTDYIIDDSTWKITSLVVSTGTWMESKNILIDTGWIKEVNWENSVVIVGMTTDEVQESPEAGV